MPVKVNWKIESNCVLVDTLIVAGYSTGEIGAALGVTRNVIVGRANRTIKHLKGRATPREEVNHFMRSRGMEARLLLTDDTWSKGNDNDTEMSSLAMPNRSDNAAFPTLTPVEMAEPPRVQTPKVEKPKREPRPVRKVVLPPDEELTPEELDLISPAFTPLHSVSEEPHFGWGENDKVRARLRKKWPHLTNFVARKDTQCSFPLWEDARSTADSSNHRYVCGAPLEETESFCSECRKRLNAPSLRRGPVNGYAIPQRKY